MKITPVQSLEMAEVWYNVFLKPIGDISMETINQKFKIGEKRILHEPDVT